MKQETTILYRGFIITVKKHSTPFGSVYTAINNSGEPYIEVLGFDSKRQAIEQDKKNIDFLLSEGTL